MYQFPEIGPKESGQELDHQAQLSSIRKSSSKICET